MRWFSFMQSTPHRSQADKVIIFVCLVFGLMCFQKGRA
ncbi:hypothetical protein SFK404_0465 [Shigella flexneri K-404]|nr:hypothetical protein SFK404_0465 [Shigella flexneri K-404]